MLDTHLEVKLPQDLIDIIPQERITGDILHGHGPRRGNLEALLRYWRPIMRKPGGFRRCIVILANHPELYPLQRICAWLHHETTGKWPNEGNHHGVRRGGGRAGRVLRRAIPGKRKRRRGKSDGGVEIASWRIYRRLGGMATRPINGDQNAIEYKAARYKQGCRSVPMPGSFEWDEDYPDYVQVETVDDLLNTKAGVVRTHGRGGRWLQSLASFFIPGDMGKYRSPIRSALWGSLTPGGGGIGGAGIGFGGTGGGLPSIGGARALRCPTGYINGGRFTDPKLTNCGGMVFDQPAEGPGAVTDVDREKMTRRFEAAAAQDLPDVVRDIVINQPSDNPFAVMREAATQPKTRPNKKRRDSAVADVLAYTAQKENETRVVRRDGVVFEPTVGPERLARMDHDNLSEAVYVTSKIPKTGGIAGDEMRLLTRGAKAIVYSFPEGSVRVERKKKMDPATAARIRVRWGGLTKHAALSYNPAEAMLRVVKEFADTLSISSSFRDIPGADDRIIVYSVLGERRIVPRWIFALYLSLRAPRRPKGIVKPFSEVPPREEEGGPTKSEYWRPERAQYAAWQIEKKSLGFGTSWIVSASTRPVSNIRISEKWGAEREALIDFKATKFERATNDSDLRVKVFGMKRRGGMRLSRFARRIPKVVPYDPDARDADVDGLVQEGTIWERPRGTRFQNMNAGARRMRVGAFLVNQNGERVNYLPGQHEGSPIGRGYTGGMYDPKYDKLRQRWATRFGRVPPKAEGVIDTRDTRRGARADFTATEARAYLRRRRREDFIRKLRTQPEYRSRRAGRLRERGAANIERAEDEITERARKLEDQRQRRVEDEAADAQRTAARQARREMGLRFNRELVAETRSRGPEGELRSARERRERSRNLIARQDRERAELNLESPSALRRQRGERVVRRGERREERRTPVLNLRSMSDEDLTKERSAIFRRHYDDMKRRGSYSGIADLPNELEDVEKELRRRNLPGPWLEEGGERGVRGLSRRDRGGARAARRREIERPEPDEVPTPDLMEGQRRRTEAFRDVGRKIRNRFKRKSREDVQRETEDEIGEQLALLFDDTGRSVDTQLTLFSMLPSLEPDPDALEDVFALGDSEFSTREETRRTRTVLSLWPRFLGVNEDDEEEHIAEPDAERLREQGVRVSREGTISGERLGTRPEDDVGSEVEKRNLRIIGDGLGDQVLEEFSVAVGPEAEIEIREKFRETLRDFREAGGNFATLLTQGRLRTDIHEKIDKLVEGLPDPLGNISHAASEVTPRKMVITAREMLAVSDLWDEGIVPPEVLKADNMMQLVQAVANNIESSADPGKVLVLLERFSRDMARAVAIADLVPVGESLRHWTEQLLASGPGSANEKDALNRLYVATVLASAMASHRNRLRAVRRDVDKTISDLKIRAIDDVGDAVEPVFDDRERGFMRSLIRRGFGKKIKQALTARRDSDKRSSAAKEGRWGFEAHGVDIEAVLDAGSTEDLTPEMVEGLESFTDDAFSLGVIIRSPIDPDMEFIIVHTDVTVDDLTKANVGHEDAEPLRSPVKEITLGPGSGLDINISAKIYARHRSQNLARQDGRIVGGFGWTDVGTTLRGVTWVRESDGSIRGVMDALELKLDRAPAHVIKGKGLSNVYNQHAFMALSVTGIDRVQMQASMDGSSLVWGMAGYRDATAEDKAARSFRSLLDNYRITGSDATGMIVDDVMADRMELLLDIHDKGDDVSLLMYHQVLNYDGKHPLRSQRYAGDAYVGQGENAYYGWWGEHASMDEAVLHLDGDVGELLEEGRQGQISLDDAADRHEVVLEARGAESSEVQPGEPIIKSARRLAGRVFNMSTVEGGLLIVEDSDNVPDVETAAQLLRDGNPLSDIPDSLLGAALMENAELDPAMLRDAIQLARDEGDPDKVLLLTALLEGTEVDPEEAENELTRQADDLLRGDPKKFVRIIPISSATTAGEDGTMLFFLKEEDGTETSQGVVIKAPEQTSDLYGDSIATEMIGIALAEAVGYPAGSVRLDDLVLLPGSSQLQPRIVFETVGSIADTETLSAHTDGGLALREASLESRLRHVVFRFVAKADDVHGQNILITDDGDVVPIDHQDGFGLSDGGPYPQESYPFLTYVRNMMAEADSTSSITSDLVGELARAIKADEITPQRVREIIEDMKDSLKVAVETRWERIAGDVDRLNQSVSDRGGDKGRLARGQATVEKAKAVVDQQIEHLEENIDMIMDELEELARELPGD